MWWNPVFISARKSTDFLGGFCIIANLIPIVYNVDKSIFLIGQKISININFIINSPIKVYKLTLHVSEFWLNRALIQLTKIESFHSICKKPLQIPNTFTQKHSSPLPPPQSARSTAYQSSSTARPPWRSKRISAWNALKSQKSNFLRNRWFWGRPVLRASKIARTLKNWPQSADPTTRA